MDDRGMITINRRGVFSLEEARGILPVEQVAQGTGKSAFRP